MSQRIVDLPPEKRPCLEKPRWKQDNYKGRLCHFLTTVNPSNLLISRRKLDEVQKIVTDYHNGKIDPDMTVNDLWHIKHVYDSAHHPTTGERIPLIGRMSAQVPMNMILIGGILAAYESARKMAFWQILNQTFNAVVNFSNRSGSTDARHSQIMAAYAAAVSSSCFVIHHLRIWSDNVQAPRLLQRFLPYCSGAAANVCNVSIMRSHELVSGISVYDSENRELGKSRVAAFWAICQVILSREVMAMPVLMLTPTAVEVLERKRWYLPYARRLSCPIQVFLAGLLLMLTTPACCAIFPQIGCMKVKSLDKRLRDRLQQLPHCPDLVYYNKGL